MTTPPTTTPLAAPVGALALWEYGPHTTPTARLTVEVSARGGREAPRRRAVLALASAYRVCAQRATLEEWRTGKNTFYKHVGADPVRIDLEGEAADVARMTAALPAVLAAIEAAATAHVRVFGRWLRHENQDYAAPAQIPGVLRRWRAEFVPSLATRLALGDAAHPGPVDPSQPWTYQDRHVAAAHVAKAGWDLPQWDAPEAAAQILAAAIRHDMSIPAEEGVPAHAAEAEEPVERESVWEEANRTRAARIQALTDAALAAADTPEGTELPRAPAPRPTPFPADAPAHVRRMCESVRAEADRLRRVWNAHGGPRLVLRRHDPVPAPGQTCRATPVPVLAPGVITPGMDVELVRDHPWRRTRFAGGRLVSVGPTACRIEIGGRTHRVPNDELTLDPTTGPAREALDAIERIDPAQAAELVTMARTWTIADHIAHARRDHRPARPRLARPAVPVPREDEQLSLFDVEPPAPAPERGGPLVVIPCSARKGEHRAPASALYIGSYHRLCARAAHALTREGGRVLILSARHGLISPETVLDPYEHRMGQAGSVNVEDLRAQADALGVADADQVVILAGRAYVAAARSVWPQAHTPLAGTRGIGHQRARLAEIVRSSTLPAAHEAVPA